MSTKPPQKRRPIAVWSIIGLTAFYISADSFLTYRGMFIPMPVSLVQNIAQGDDREYRVAHAWHRRMKTLLPGLVLTAAIGALAHHFGFRCAAARPGKTPTKRLALPFALANRIPAADQWWLYWTFITLFYAVPFGITAYLATEFFAHPNLYYNDDVHGQVWCTFFSAETWNFFGLFHRRPILWSNDIEFQRGIYPMLLLLILAVHAYAFTRFTYHLYRPRDKMGEPAQTHNIHSMFAAWMLQGNLRREPNGNGKQPSKSKARDAIRRL